MQAALTTAPVQHRLALHLLQVEAAAASNRSRASKGPRLFGGHLLPYSRPRTAGARPELPSSPTSQDPSTPVRSITSPQDSESGSGHALLGSSEAAAAAAGASHGGSSQGQQQGYLAASEGGDEAAGSSAPAVQLEVPTVAIRRRMLQSSCGRFLMQLGHEETRVEVRDIGLYKFKGTPDPVLMAAVSTARLAGRPYPDAAPLGKVRRRQRSECGVLCCAERARIAGWRRAASNHV